MGLDQVNLVTVMDYLSLLFDEGRAYKTILVHRSTISSMLPPIDGFSIGNHPTVSRLIRGIFQNRPPSRRMFQSWNVTSVFEKLPPPDTFVNAQRRCAFLLAMASSRRPSEIASLKCSTAFMTISADKVRFIPSRLSKTDRQNYLGPAIVIHRLPSPSPQSPCPVEALESLLSLRNSLNITHDHIFSLPHPPFDQIDVGNFSRLIKECFRRAGVSAPPGSTRSISVSDAFAKGASIDEVMKAGDWSASSTFFNHYLRPSASF